MRVLGREIEMYPPGRHAFSGEGSSWRSKRVLDTFVTLELQPVLIRPEKR